MGRAVTRDDKRAFALAVWELLRLHQASMTHADRFMDALIKLTDGIDYVTQELAITILADEEGHRQQFQGYLKEYVKK